jgi:predicted DNA-binding transcriptional regulator YafY
LLQLEPTERAALERLSQTNLDSQTHSAILKVLADSPSLAKNLAVDQAELISRTTHLGQVGPSIRVKEGVMSVLEPAIQGFKEIRILYRASGKPRATWRTFRPLGLLFSRFGHLVAFIKGGAPLTFRLDLVQKAELAGTYFEPRQNWDFKSWASESFGIFHGDALLDVKLRFTGEAARRVERITFHSSQRTEKGPNGSLVVYLRCRGHRELIHELCHPDWLGSVVIEEPETLKLAMKNYLERVLNTACKGGNPTANSSQPVHTA